METNVDSNILILLLSFVFHNTYAGKISEGSAAIHHNCSENEVFVKCKSCEVSCDGLKVCEETCRSGCVCKLFRDGHGKCVDYEKCPPLTIYNNVNPNSGMFSSVSPFSHSSIEDCAPDEVFSSCGWCEPSCVEPSPSCPSACTRGCLCRPPLLRHHSGHCVKKEDCVPRKCSQPNEEFVCRHGCEGRCVTFPCERQSRCRLGCHCRRGMLRDSRGQCVDPEQCDHE
ncbi:zonadhesin [Danaus plexippus]|uniref:zonadhesin n=1 Tax=Danaus plexippus TaxID=13037 RepID=UPI002AB15FD8|nr:zonadhesin [Danaus plexippus]